MSKMRVGCILEQAAYKPGDQAPEGYLAWHEWAKIQHKAGLRQKQCGRCGLFHYPQQLSATVDRAELTVLRKRKPARVTVETPVCNDCEAAAHEIERLRKYAKQCLWLPSSADDGMRNLEACDVEGGTHED